MVNVFGPAVGAFAALLLAACAGGERYGGYCDSVTTVSEPTRLPWGMGQAGPPRSADAEMAVGYCVVVCLEDGPPPVQVPAAVTPKSEGLAGWVTDASGEVIAGEHPIVRIGTTNRFRGNEIDSGEAVTIGVGGTATLTLTDQSLLRSVGLTRFRIQEGSSAAPPASQYRPRTRIIMLEQGTVDGEIKPSPTLHTQFDTPLCHIGLAGGATAQIAAPAPDRVTVRIDEGKARVFVAGSTLELRLAAGQGAELGRDPANGTLRIQARVGKGDPIEGAAGGNRVRIPTDAAFRVIRRTEGYADVIVDTGIVEMVAPGLFRTVQ